LRDCSDSGGVFPSPFFHQCLPPITPRMWVFPQFAPPLCPRPRLPFLNVLLSGSFPLKKNRFFRTLPLSQSGHLTHVPDKLFPCVARPTYENSREIVPGPVHSACPLFFYLFSDVGLDSGSRFPPARPLASPMDFFLVTCPSRRWVCHLRPFFLSTLPKLSPMVDPKPRESRAVAAILPPSLAP